MPKIYNERNADNVLQNSSNGSNLTRIVNFAYIATFPVWHTV